MTCLRKRRSRLGNSIYRAQRRDPARDEVPYVVRDDCEAECFRRSGDQSICHAGISTCSDGSCFRLTGESGRPQGDGKYLVVVAFDQPQKPRSKRLGFSHRPGSLEAMNASFHFVNADHRYKYLPLEVLAFDPFHEPRNGLRLRRRQQRNGIRIEEKSRQKSTSREGERFRSNSISTGRVLR